MKQKRYDKAFIILNHPLLPEQERELKEKFGVKEILTLPKDLAAKWRQITPDSVKEVSESIIKWVRENTSMDEDSMAVVQGHFATTSYLVVALKANNIDPYYAHTKREVVEMQKPDGSVEKRAIFRHEGFYPYHLPENIYVMYNQDDHLSVAEFASLDGKRQLSTVIESENGKKKAIVANWFTKSILEEYSKDSEAMMIDMIWNRLRNYEDFIAEKTSELFWDVVHEVEREVEEELIQEQGDFLNP